jgi:DNA-binding NarL/FixJ family response regulator
MTPARILLIEDHQIMHGGLRMLLHGLPEFRVVGDACDTEAAWLAAKRLAPDLVTLDMELPGSGGLALANRLGRRLPSIKVVVFTEHAEPRFVNETLRAGVRGYVLKLDGSAQVVAALRAVLAGNVYLSPEISTLVVREYRRQIDTTENPASNLSPRELDILKRITKGQTTEKIACALSARTKTVETHLAHLLTKLGVKSVAELTKFAVRAGLTAL